MKKLHIAVITILILLTAGLAFLRLTSDTEPKGNSQLMPAPPSITLDLVKMAAEGKMPAAVEVNVRSDLVLKKSARFEAYSLRAVLEPYVRELGIDQPLESDAVVTFHCLDGYQPTQKLSELLAAEGYLAFRDATITAPEKNWPDSLQTKLAPFYLVWEDGADGSLTRPYALYKIEINKINRIYDPIYPKARPEAIAGFQHFEHYCIKCHSINKVGGNVGPDLNFPKNITEYWDVEQMWAYAKNPQSFRYNARMAPILPLTRPEFDQIIVYLKYISAIKPETSLAEQVEAKN